LFLRLLGGRVRAGCFDLLHLFRRGFLHRRSSGINLTVHGFTKECLVMPDEYGRKKTASVGGSFVFCQSSNNKASSSSRSRLRFRASACSIAFT
jgi:hypothetical protein